MAAMGIWISADDLLGQALRAVASKAPPWRPASASTRAKCAPRPDGGAGHDRDLIGEGRREL